jgi:hypothetical protein
MCKTAQALAGSRGRESSMSKFSIFADVVFGIYVANFMGSYLNSRFDGRPKARVWADIAVGIFLLLLVLIS